MNLFQLGDFTLSSGSRSPWKIDCDALTQDDIRCLAAMINQMVGPFSSVEGVPRGGLRLAEVLRLRRGKDGPLLLVDDVLTTGMSMEARRAGREEKMIGAVIFARGPCPYWVKPVFQMPECFWVKLPSSE